MTEKRTVTLDQMFDLPMWELRKSIDPKSVRWNVPLRLQISVHLTKIKMRRP